MVARIERLTEEAVVTTLGIQLHMVGTDTSDTLAIGQDHPSVVHDLTTYVELLDISSRAGVAREATRLSVLLEL